MDADRQLARVAARLSDRGALGLLLVEARPLEDIERRYGAETHGRVLEALMGFVREAAQAEVPEEDVEVTGLPGEDSVLVFLFRPRSDRAFYASKLRSIARRMGAMLTHDGRRVVYPYHRDPLVLPIGTAVELHNPDVNPEREVRRAVKSARRDARLEAALQARERTHQLLELILGERLSIRFEPIVDLRRNQVLGYEALARGPEGTQLQSPAQLFRFAEEADLAYELDCLCRRLALGSSRAIPQGKKLFLNVLPTALGDPNLRAEGLRKTLEGYPLSPSDLVLEISEKESIGNFATFREMRDSCRELGVQVAVDDAGAGHASLEAIMEIAPDFLKADMALVRGIDNDPPRQEVVRSLGAVARRIGATVIAEGIETEGELRVVRELGIQYGQGYHFGQALTTETLESDAG